MPRPKIEGSPNQGAKALLAWRQEKGLTQRQAAEHFGLKQQTWQGWETVGRPPLSKRGRAVMAALGIDLAQFDLPVSSGGSSLNLTGGALQGASPAFSGLVP